MVQSAIRKAIEAKHPPRDYAEREIERPRPPRKRRGVHRVYHAAGFDVIVDDPRAARLLRDQVSNVERPSGLVGFEKTGEPIGEDDDPREPA